MVYRGIISNKLECGTIFNTVNDGSMKDYTEALKRIEVEVAILTALRGVDAMSTQLERKKCLTVNRILVVGFIMSGIWLDSAVLSSVGSLCWLFMPTIAHYELLVLDKLRGKK